MITKITGAVVTVAQSPYGSPLEFAQDLGNAWGVGDADRQDGIVILIDIANRRTEMTAGPGVPELDYTRVTGAATSFFGRGDFDSYGHRSRLDPGSLDRLEAVAFGSAPRYRTPGRDRDHRCFLAFKLVGNLQRVGASQTPFGHAPYPTVLSVAGGVQPLGDSDRGSVPQERSRGRGEAVQ